MLVRFSSVATESITMFGDVAVQLIRMLGASGAVPGAIDAAGIPAAVQRLRRLIAQEPQAGNEPVEGIEGDGEQEDRDPPIGLKMRAQPLIDVLERAAAAQVPVMWEVA